MTELIKLYPQEIYIGIVVVAMVASPFLHALFGRVAFRIVIRTEGVIDDLLIDALRPFRFVYAFPVCLAFFLANMA